MKTILKAGFNISGAKNGTTFVSTNVWLLIIPNEKDNILNFSMFYNTP
jgi:uncharacterized membrane protein